jgi:hypothetical protein
MSGEGFEVVDNDNDDVFEFHETSSQQEGLLRCIYRQKVTYRYAVGTYTKGEIRKEQCCCCLPRYTILKRPRGSTVLTWDRKERELTPRFKIHPRPRWLVGCLPFPCVCCSKSFPPYEIFHADDQPSQDIPSGHIISTSITYPIDALEDEMICILGSKVLINNDYL